MSDLDATQVRLHDLLVPAQRWHAREAAEVDCYDIEGFASGEPVRRRGDALAADMQCVAPGDLLVYAHAHSTPRTWVVGETRGAPQVASADWLVIRSDVLDSAYARHLFVSNEFQMCCRGRGVSSGRGRARARVEVPDVILRLPSIDRQRIAGRLLDHADALRSKRALVRSGAREGARSMFIHEFGADLANAHRRTALLDLLSEPPGRGVEAQLQASGTFPVLRPTEIRDGRLSFAEAKYVAYSDTALARTALSDGDVLIACDPGRSDVRCAVARPGTGVWFMHTKVWRLRADPQQLCPEYLHAWLLSAAGRERVLRAWTADRRSPVEHRLGGLKLPLPPIERQRVFADAANAIDRLEGALQASAERLDALLGTLRDLAFRGELKLA